MSESINASIDNFIARQSIAAPEEARYSPVWTPPRERPELDYRAAGITSIVWCIGFRTDYRWVDLPVFNGRVQLVHVRVASVPGSGRFSGVARDAEYLAEHIEARAGLALAARQATLNEAAIGS